MKKVTGGLLVVVGMVIGSVFTLALSPAGAASALVGAAAPPSGSHQSLLGQALDTLVGKGTISQSQADAVKNQVDTLEKQHPHGRGGPGRGGFGPMSLGHDPLGQLATLLHTDRQTLMSDLAAGQSIADVATAHGVDPGSVVKSLVAKAEDGLTDAVSRGWLTQAQADAIEAKLPDQIQAMVDQKWGGMGHGPGLGLFGPGGAMTPPATPATPATPPSTAPGAGSPPVSSAPSTTAPPSTTTPPPTSTTPTTA